VNFKNTQKTGAYPWGSFGIGGASATELPVPVDHRTTDVGTNLEFANDRGDARFGYDWFDKYKVQDFALGPVASLAQPATATPALMMLGCFYRE
jgi:hypothetical protein